MIMKDAKLKARVARAVFFLPKCNYSIVKYSGRQVRAAASCIHTVDEAKRARAMLLGIRSARKIVR